MKKNLITAVLMTIVTTVLLGIIYPLVVTALSQVLFRDKANGQLVSRDGRMIGSRIIGQPFSGAGYFHPRLSAAGTNGYDASSSGGTNYAATNQKLLDRVKGEVDTLRGENPSIPIPIDLVTTSASGLDPDITPANAYFQAARVAKARNVTEKQIRLLVAAHTKGRDLGLLGEPRINVLELNLALDTKFSTRNISELDPKVTAASGR
ncbi:MAG TPA: potassium-transporting ATPase subunit KdpC [Terriglobales bacterium]|nr:potassium-transporting ATPase subunit KdpC [Terriglobales bacterium]